jgi:hypothetical protein
LPAICGLLVAVIFASHYALTSDFWAAAQLASVIAAGMAEVLKAIVRRRDKRAGVYATTVHRGHLAIGQPVFLERAAH